MFGDAKEDYNAAKENDIPFIFRKHNSNMIFQQQYQGVSIKDFYEAPR